MFRLLICVGLISIVYTSSTEREYTIQVPKGGEECFYQKVLAGEYLDVDYQVIDGGSLNEMEINFKILRPDGLPLVADNRKSDSSHKLNAEMTGDYKICFDNTFSNFAYKSVFFEIIVEDENEDTFGDEEFNAMLKERNEDYSMQAIDIEKALRSIKEHVTKSRHFQEQIRSSELRDRSVAEHNFENVNFWSCIHILIMICSGILQVIIVRSLFEDKSIFKSKFLS